MMAMAEKGIPVTGANVPNLSDGETNPSWDIPLDKVRGVDVAQLWQESRTIKEKVKRSHYNDVRKYGK